MFRQIIDRYRKRLTHRRPSRRHRRDAFNNEVVRHLRLESLEVRRLLAFDLSISSALTGLTVGLINDPPGAPTTRTFIAPHVIIRDIDMFLSA